MEENSLHAMDCMENIESGGVLVSPFINEFEKDIREKAEAQDGKIIKIRKEPFPEKFKPESHDFKRCTKGNLLILAPCKDIFPKVLNYTTASALNKIASIIAAYKNA